MGELFRRGRGEAAAIRDQTEARTRQRHERPSAGSDGPDCGGPDGDGAVRVSSTKSLHGHLLGAAGALEFAVALLALEQGIVAPTGYLEQPDPACRLRHVAMKAEKIEPPRAVMSNSFAFGGSNVVLIAERA